MSLEYPAPLSYTESFANASKQIIKQLSIFLSFKKNEGIFQGKLLPWEEILHKLYHTLCMHILCMRMYEI